MPLDNCVSDDDDGDDNDYQESYDEGDDQNDRLCTKICLPELLKEFWICEDSATVITPCSAGFF